MVSDNAHVSVCNRRFIHRILYYYYYYVLYVKTQFVGQREFRLGFKFLVHSIINSMYRTCTSAVNFLFPMKPHKRNRRPFRGRYANEVYYLGLSHVDTQGTEKTSS